jgi:glycosyltransferase involved in cell wall biosynthesis
VISEVDVAPEAAAKAGARGLERVKREYSWDKIVDSLEAVYRGI